MNESRLNNQILYDFEQLIDKMYNKANSSQ